MKKCATFGAQRSDGQAPSFINLFEAQDFREAVTVNPKNFSCIPNRPDL